MFDTFKNRLEITGTLTTVTALRISAGRSTEPIGSDLPVIKDALGRPLIPGSSFKGALRSRLESFLRGIDPNLAEDPANYTTSTRNNQVKAFKEKYKNNDLNLTQELIGITDDIGSLFGTPWMASKFQVRDLTVQPDAWFGQYQERDGVAIDRDTETAADGKLYDYQVVPAATPFDFKAVVENAHDWELGLLMIGLHQFETEQIPLGGGRSRGLGVVKLEIDKMRWIDVEDHPEFLLEYLQKLVMGDETAYEDAADYKDEWVQKLIDRLTPKQTKSSETITQTQ
ncbi:MAG: CRISPR-associated RAMP protein [Microcoleus sp. PH2017_29_MFU_D_A]|uniref:type III CRISPR-associated RAMP protein Csx7 n=1 Tax=unclassified Microcoleus TaxID=2642155 RepID=UPI001DE40186|nr:MULTISPECIES: CRISPR-associated RAMP protein Csx7 [unclassified Microcoleus]MCC3420375.1 CRISPR-associated RAMP protein [Microcoleus sp. PH2017_07_MST_O_A]MCC3469913.1 CRISPR-associated RAMP protein [Microcoleus sp. PH2017_06_SFM_O_A]MCC3502024.1 CRISPR-associated RAMP protein [Microcoleus sp. PH2017_19_SFW_U_A]MCC3508665.1 CRISPR-associated RAMP protein [Microcoleus sp. PH2017_17_BER_D_A]TAF88044.1 MAG: CRISPR-associated RAMP protein [Oscillatoriales cyanobacterium]